MFTFTTIADQSHKLTNSIISLIPVEELKKPLTQAENVRYGIAISMADYLDKTAHTMKEGLGVKA